MPGDIELIAYRGAPLTDEAVGNALAGVARTAHFRHVPGAAGPAWHVIVVYQERVGDPALQARLVAGMEELERDRGGRAPLSDLVKLAWRLTLQGEEKAGATAARADAPRGRDAPPAIMRMAEAIGGVTDEALWLLVSERTSLLGYASFAAGRPPMTDDPFVETGDPTELGATKWAAHTGAPVGLLDAFYAVHCDAGVPVRRADATAQKLTYDPARFHPFID